ncbi:hypothetical protein [Pseudomonas sp. B22(2017)]|uniref:hypothetical protein n=1 Tax=Pseudomonas sp. B22(2017) TaxID=1981736 RepID=UPI00117996F1|nr:hypothetical protein [Pseudomonas sp. B22(2017)]
MHPDFLELSVLDKAKSNLKRVVPHSCLDTPSHRQLGNGKLSFAGWFLKDHHVSDIHLVIRNGHAEHQVYATVERRDVLSSVLRVSQDVLSVHPQLHCGFKVTIEVDLNQPVDIIFVVDNEEYPWRVIHAAATGFKAASLQNLWSEFVNCKDVRKLAADLSGFLAKISDAVLDDIIFRGVQVSSLKELSSGKVPIELSRAVPFLKYVTSSDFCIDAVETALSKGSVIVPDPFGYGMACCNESYVMGNEINVLRFVSSTGEACFVFQHVGSADAIYFPTKNIIALTPHLSDGLVRGFIYKLVRNMVEVSAYASGGRGFSGIIASHSRPYHFYYDVAPAVGALHDARFLERLPSIVHYKGADFCSLSSLYGVNVPEALLAPEEVWSKVTKIKGFYFHVGSVFDQTRVDCVNRFDRRFVSLARKGIVSLDPIIAKGLMSCYPLIWFGVTVQKRSWLEQVDSAVNILNSLKTLYPEVGVVFDGWTSPMHPTPRDQRETDLDNGVVKEIRKSLDPSIPVFNVVGADSVKKIQYASFVDAYVGNSGTGGLHVARFAGRPGVAHLNTKMLNANNHIRKRTRLIDVKHIVDRPEDSDLRMDFISYSLDWQVVYDELVQVIEGVSK